MGVDIGVGVLGVGIGVCVCVMYPTSHRRFYVLASVHRECFFEQTLERSL